MNPQDYVLGHSAGELERLDLQGVLYRDITVRALTAAGIANGMSVLDIGCGSGDVTRLVGTMVGPSGSVLGIDRDEGTIGAARQRTCASQGAKISFRVHEIGEPLPEQPFDALVGRFILMHQEHPGEVLAAAAAAVRPVGLVVIIESNMRSLLDTQHSVPKLQFYDEIVRWKCRVVGAAGADLSAGLRLRQTFLEAGLAPPVLRMEAPVEGGEASVIYPFMADSCRSMLPRARKFGIDGMDEVDLDALEDRLRTEVVAGGGVIVGWPAVSAWCRTATDVSEDIQ